MQSYHVVQRYEYLKNLQISSDFISLLLRERLNYILRTLMKYSRQTTNNIHIRLDVKHAFC